MPTLLEEEPPEEQELPQQPTKLGSAKQPLTSIPGTLDQKAQPENKDTSVTTLPTAKAKQLQPECPICGYEGTMINGSRQAYPTAMVQDVVYFFGSTSENKLQKLLLLTADESWQTQKTLNLTQRVLERAAKRMQTKEPKEAGN